MIYASGAPADERQTDLPNHSSLAIPTAGRAASGRMTMAKKKTATGSKKTTKKTAKKTTRKKTTSAAKTTSKTTGRKTAKSATSGRRSSSTKRLTYDRIAERAYQIWQASGCVPGRDQENWKLAEEQLKAELS
jgi:hypothetical protein